MRKLKTKTRKWPLDWIAHIFNTCFLYFEDTDITLIDEKITTNCIVTAFKLQEEMWGITLTLEKNNKNYDVFIRYDEPFFTVHYYYKEYGKMQKIENDLNVTIDTSELGSNQYGFFYYSYIGAEGGVFKSAYDIVKSVEYIINKHSNKDDDDRDDGGNKEVDPVVPFIPTAVGPSSSDF
jgi:hypothetical protein